MRAPSAFDPSLNTQGLRADTEQARSEVFDARAAREEDLRAAAAEHAERERVLDDHRRFLEEMEAWIDGLRASIPDPLPADLDKTIVKYP